VPVTVIVAGQLLASALALKLSASPQAPVPV